MRRVPYYFRSGTLVVLKKTACKYIVYPDEALPNMPIGGKAKSLSILFNAKVSVPRWFVITPQAFYDSMTPEQKSALDGARNEASIQSVIQSVVPDAQFQSELRAILSEYFAPQTLLAVRSSALDEDGAEHSFAGQLESYLFVSVEEVISKVVRVWQSGFSQQVLEYRKAHQLPLIPSAPAVIIQEMINADISGIAFGADPVSGDTTVKVISALYGLGTALVSGECDADMYTIDSYGEISAHIAHKTKAHVFNPSGQIKLVNAVVPENLTDIACLQNPQVTLLGQWIDYLSQLFAYPQDIEWAISKGEFYILQSRPITTPLKEKTAASFYKWDNGNLESWVGVVKPLTYSMLKRIYIHKFKQVCLSLRVPTRVIMENESLFHRMIGYIQGQIFFNVQGLYEVWSLSHAYRRYERWFVEYTGDKGLDPDHPPHPMSAKVKGGWQNHLIELYFTGLAFGGLLWDHLTWNHRVNQFFTYIRKILVLTPTEFSKVDLPMLVYFYHHMESVFYKHWYVPALNNFMTSFFYTLLGKCTRAWCQDTDESLRNNLLCGEGDILSAEPIRYMNKMANVALKFPNLATYLCEADLNTLMASMNQCPEFKNEFDTFLALFGERCHEDLKLESPNIQDEPLVLLRSIGQLARQIQSKKGKSTGETGGYYEAQIRAEAQERVQQAAAGKPWRLWVMNWVIKNARSTMANRENIRFEQTRLMGRFRVLFQAIGQRLHSQALLDSPQDVFFLDIEEIIGYIEGTLTCPDLKETTSLRKAHHEVYCHLPALPNTFITQGSVYKQSLVIQEVKEDLTEILDPADGDGMKGISCSPGIVQGPVFIMDGQKDANLGLTGKELLIAEHGDPGLVMLFPSVAGLLFERGSPLSHLAIVAREMGIPTIMSLSGLSHWVKDGDWLEMDGKTGKVKKIDPPIS